MSRTPSLESLITRARSTIGNQLGNSNPAIDAIASAIAGANFGQYAYQDFLFQQLNPETANEEWLYLWATRFKVDRLSASYSTGTATFNLTSGIVNVPEGAVVKSSDGQEYQVVTATYSDQPVPIKAMQSGAESNLPAGIKLSLITAVTGLNPDSIVCNEIAGGAPIEEVEHWRSRIVTKFNEKQIVGRREDYEYWAVSSHQDIDIAWALDNTPVVGNVTVYIAAKQQQPLLSDEIKTTAQTYVDANRLAGCHVFVQAPQLKVVNFSISEVSNIETRDQIHLALQQYLIERLGSREILRPNELSNVIQNISAEFTLLLPSLPIELEAHELYIMGNVTWL